MEKIEVLRPRLPCPEHRPFDDLGFWQYTVYTQALERAGIFPSRCPVCGRWFYPEEMQGQDEGKN